MILKIDTYVDDETGRQIAVGMEINNPIDPKVDYIGTAMLDTQMGQVPIQFKIEAESIVDAFDKYEEAGKARVAEIEKEQAEASRIVDASGNPTGKDPLQFPQG